jgi:hypothetical protein
MIFEKCNLNYLHNIYFTSNNKRFYAPALNSLLIIGSYYFIYKHIQENGNANLFDYAHYFLIIISRSLIVSFKYGFFSDFHHQLFRQAKLPVEINENGLILRYLDNTKSEVEM